MRHTKATKTAYLDYPDKGLYLVFLSVFSKKGL